ncbi:MAG TPA: sigma-70 family RNA polymerase sigma factor [Polyangia bacterium]
MPLRILRGEVTDFESDESLVAALRRGESRAELAAWNRFSARVDTTLRRLLGPGEDREDLLQEVFIRFFKRVGTLREPSAVVAFLAGISVNVVHAEIARRRRRNWLRLTATGSPPDISGPQPNTDAREAVARYYRQLETLAAKDRSIFVARTIEGLTLAEVAALHGMSVSTTQRRLARATKRISFLVRRDPLLMNLVEEGNA